MIIPESEGREEDREQKEGFSDNRKKWWKRRKSNMNRRGLEGEEVLRSKKGEKWRIQQEGIEWCLDREYW